eukprot:2741776-Rhodomonas_salina.3
MLRQYGHGREFRTKLQDGPVFYDWFVAGMQLLVVEFAEKREKPVPLLFATLFISNTIRSHGMQSFLVANSQSEPGGRRGAHVQDRRGMLPAVHHAHRTCEFRVRSGSLCTIGSACAT